MITLDQIRLLDEKVRKAVDFINTLKQENASLKNRLEGYESRISELEVLIENFKNDQGQIEEGIQKALDQLDYIQEGSSKNEIQEADSSENEEQKLEEIDSEEETESEAEEETKEESPESSEQDTLEEPVSIEENDDTETQLFDDETSKTAELDIF